MKQKPRHSLWNQSLAYVLHSSGKQQDKGRKTWRYAERNFSMPILMVRYILNTQSGFSKPFQLQHPKLIANKLSLKI